MLTRVTIRPLFSKWAPYIAAILLVILSIPVTTSPAYATSCSLSEANIDDSQHAWASDEAISNLEGARVTLDYYDPDPVYQASWFWTNVMTDSWGQWAQIGWVELGSQHPDYSSFAPDEPIPYLEHWNGATMVRRYRTSTAWVSSTTYAIAATDGAEYEVYKNGSEWWYTYDGGTTFKTASGSWIAEDVMVAGEIHDYSSVTEEGDHFPGDKTTKISANDSEKRVSGSWSDTSLTDPTSWPSGSPVGRADLSNSDSATDGVRIWDNRCTS